ncbi:unnamed protein product [Ectocarpus fasciculatus]
MGEFDDEEDDDDVDDDDLEDGEEIQEFEFTVDGSDEGDGAADLDDDDAAAAAGWESDVVDYEGSDRSALTVHDVGHIAEDVVDYQDDDVDDDDDDDDIDNLGGGGGGGARGGGEKASARGSSSSSSQSSSRITWTEQQPGRDADDYGDPSRPQSSSPTAPDFGGEKYCGDLTDQVSDFIPFKSEEEDYHFPDSRGRRRGGVRSSRRERSERHRSLNRQSVYADLVMPYGDPHGEGGQGIVSIPVKFSVQESQDDDEDDDGGGGGGGVSS